MLATRNSKGVSEFVWTDLAETHFHDVRDAGSHKLGHEPIRLPMPSQTLIAGRGLNLVNGESRCR